jgi:hypothetical protein
MQVDVPHPLGVQPEVDPLGRQYRAEGRGRATHRRAKRSCLSVGQLRDVLAVAPQHDEPLAGHQQGPRAQEEDPVLAHVHDPAGRRDLASHRLA